MQRPEVFHSHPEILSGAAVFVGTRVPVRTLLDYIEAGDSLDVFLEDFPGVRREQAVWFLEHVRSGEMRDDSGSSPNTTSTNA